MKKIILLLALLFIFVGNSFSADEFLSPYQCMKNFKENIIDKNKPSQAVKSMNFTEKEQKSNKTTAERLGKILTAKTTIINLPSIPKSNNYFDSTEQKNIYFPFSGEKWFYLEKVENNWLISAETIDNVLPIYNEIYFIDINNFEKGLSPFFLYNFIGLKVWQWFGIFIYLLLSIALYFIFNKILITVLERIISRYVKKIPFQQYLMPIAKPSSFLLILTGLLIVINLLQLPIGITSVIGYIIKFLMPLLFVIIAFRLTNILGAIMLKIAAKTENTVDDQIIPMIIKLIKVVVVIIGTIYIVSNMGWDIAPLLAGASIGGLAFALAAQDTIKNLFGSFTMFTDQPFEVGDWIVFDGGEGTVEEIGIRSTRVRTFYDSLISVPNGNLANAVIDNMGRRKFRRYMTNIGLTYDTKPESIDAFVEGLKAIVHNQENTRKDYYQIHLSNFGSSAIEVLLYIFFDVKDWTEELEARHQFLSEVIKLADSLEVKFAFNTQTLHIESMPNNDAQFPLNK